MSYPTPAHKWLLDSITSNNFSDITSNPYEVADWGSASNGNTGNGQHLTMNSSGDIYWKSARWYGPAASNKMFYWANGYWVSLNEYLSITTYPPEFGNGDLTYVPYPGLTWNLFLGTSGNGQRRIDFGDGSTHWLPRYIRWYYDYAAWYAAFYGTSAQCKFDRNYTVYKTDYNNSSIVTTYNGRIGNAGGGTTSVFKQNGTNIPALDGNIYNVVVQNTSRGNVAYFNKSLNNYLKIFPDSTFNPLSSDFAIALWIKVDPANTMTTAGIISHWNSTSNYRSWRLYWNSSKLHFSVSSDGTNTTTVSTTSPLSAGVWHYVVVQRASNTLQIYVDGYSQGATSFTGSIYTASNIGVYIGDIEYGSPSSGNQFQGWISDVEMFSSSLSSGDIAAAAGVPSQTSVNSNKIVGSLSVYNETSDAQFKEQGSVFIAGQDYRVQIYEAYKKSNYKYLYYCGFNNTYPYTANTSVKELRALHLTETVLFEDIILRSFDAAEDTDFMNTDISKTSYISKCLPWVIACDLYGNITTNYVVRLYGTGSLPHGVDIAPTPNGFVTSVIPSWTPSNMVNEIVDLWQTSTTGTQNMSSYFWHSFTPNRSGGLYSWHTAASGGGGSGYPNRIRIYSGEGTDGTMLYDNVTANSGSSEYGGFGAKWTFPSKPYLKAGQQYTIKLYYVGGDTPSSTHEFYIHTGNPYAGGRMSAGSNIDMKFATTVDLGNKIKHSMTIVPLSGDIIVRAFGLMYDSTIYNP